jgi:hypothetical protein
MTSDPAITDPVWARTPHVRWAQRLLDSFHRWTGRQLIDRGGPAAEQARRLFTAPFVVVSHGTEEDPLLNYGNQAALELWEMTWDQLIGTPSRRTAEPVNQAERARLLQLVTEHGSIDRYRGVRISATGKRFLVEAATVWNVVDEQGRRVGQAATFSQWTKLA